MPATGLTTSAFGGPGTGFPPEVYPGILSAIAGGNPFAQSLTRWGSGISISVFRTITGMSGAKWINEGDVKPVVTIDTTGVVVTARSWPASRCCPTGWFVTAGWISSPRFSG